ncbi:hypothetical protein QAD02_005168 [Eretmocerus hayati]|uniref:Uncharacterized protein n=1 Tax=Eretmocerus hayati TaxID=131215 RepID=A0ACC2NSR0_9HYME|nr:hypothetical protein QAD02_005168 [Eretmocerus hayati]
MELEPPSGPAMPLVLGTDTDSESEVRPVAIAPEETIPFATKFVLEGDVEVIRDDSARDVRQVVADAFPKSFTKGELTTCCIIGSRMENPGKMPTKKKPQGLPLNPSVLNA